MQRNLNTFCACVWIKSCATFFALQQSRTVVTGRMEFLFSLMSPAEFVFACAAALLAGLIKGMVGFAMPMIMISALSTIIAPELALAGLIVPTLAANGIQALRQGPAAAWASVQQFKVFLLVGAGALAITSQMVSWISPSTFLVMLGGAVVAFTMFQLFGLRFHLSAQSPRIEVGIGLVAGGIGGFSGVWGPPTVAYLTALNTPKADQVRIQGVIYGLGAVALTFAHITSGVLRWETLPLSVALVVPAMLGMRIGMRLHDRIDQVTFRKATLVVLTVAGLNLLRRGLVEIL